MNRDPRYPKATKTVVAEANTVPVQFPTYTYVTTTPDGIGSIPAGHLWWQLPNSEGFDETLYVGMWVEYLGTKYLITASSKTENTPAAGTDELQVTTGGTFTQQAGQTIHLYAALTLYQASHGDLPGVFTDKMDQCQSCNSDWPVEDMTYWRERAYCPDCKSDILRLILSERRVRARSQSSGETDFS